jgi:pimeloyl-ACP methyl ester carboxylesterase
VFPAEIYRAPRSLGERAFGNLIYWNEVEKGGHVAADDVQSMVISGVGHWIAEEAPEELLTALTEFLAPYRDGEAAAHESHERSVDT